MPWSLQNYSNYRIRREHRHLANPTPLAIHLPAPAAPAYCYPGPLNNLPGSPAWQPTLVGSCKQQRVLSSSIWRSKACVLPSKETLKLVKHLPPSRHLTGFAYNDALHPSTLGTTRASTLANFPCKSQKHCYSKSLSAGGFPHALSTIYHCRPPKREVYPYCHPDCHPQPCHLSCASTWRLPQVLTADNSKKLLFRVNDLPRTDTGILRKLHCTQDPES